MDKADLRPHVLEALREKPETQFAGVHTTVASVAPGYDRAQDKLAVREIIWELLVQGVLAPGLDSLNLELPHIHVTEYGRQCLAANAILPHDPDGYVRGLQGLIGGALDGIVLTYVRESLLTFLAGRHLAAVVMLGVASERCVDLLIESYLNAIANASKKTAFERKVKQAGRSVKRRFDALRGELLGLALPPDLGDALDIHLSGIFTLIRYSRNDAGHPTGQAVGRDVAHGNLLLFPQYCRRVYGLIDYFRANTV